MCVYVYLLCLSTFVCGCVRVRYVPVHSSIHVGLDAFRPPLSIQPTAIPHPNNDLLPRCFNQLDLPNYSSKESMRQKLVVAITEGSEGFAMA